MASSKALRDTDWLTQYFHSNNDHTGIDSPQVSLPKKDQPHMRQESPGRSKYTPIIVPGEEAPPLIVVESRDISPAARKSGSCAEQGSPRSESYDHQNHRRSSSRGNTYKSRSRTLSPQPRPRTSHAVSKSDENLGSISDFVAAKQQVSYVAKIESKESAAQSDAVTTPHANGKGKADYSNRPTVASQPSISGNISPTSDFDEEDVIPNVASMTSSLTSMDSKDDRVNEKHYLPSSLRQHNALTKHEISQSLKNKNANLQHGEQRSRKSDKDESKKSVRTTISKGQRHIKSDVSILGDYPSIGTPIRTTLTTPDIIYDALNDGGTSCSQLDDNGTSMLSYNLSGALRGSSSDTASFFHDFQNPIIAPSSKNSPTRSSKLVGTSEAKNYNVDRPTSKSFKKSHIPPPEGENQYARRQCAPTRSAIDNENDEVVSTYSTVNDITNHSILQLCTEDLMSDNANRVGAALERLYEVCCFINDRNVDETMNATSSVVSTSSASASVLNRIRFIKAGGHALIVGVMKKFIGNANIQAAACKLIRQLILMDEGNGQSSSTSINEQFSSNRNGNGGAFNELFSAVYGMDCVIGALQRFHSPMSNRDNINGDVYNLACGALVAIVCSSFKMVDRLLQHDTRYISIFLKAMHAPINKKTPGVNRVVYYVLKQFPQYVNEVVIAGGIEDVINEMKQCPDSMEVQYCGCAAIGTLLKKNSRMIMSTLSTHYAQRYNDQSVVDYIVNHLDGATAIVAALKAFAYNEDIQGKGVIALCNITMSAAATKVNATIISSIKKAGGLSAIGIALENFPSNQTVQDHGCLAIKSLLEASIVAPTTK